MLVSEPTVVKKKGGRKTSAFLIAIAVHAVVILVSALIEVLPYAREEPEIVAQVVAPAAQPEIKLQKKQVMKQAKEASASAAASPIAQMIRSNSIARIAAPKVTKFSDGPIGLGEGDFGSGFGMGGGGGGGMGSGATFFGGKSTGNRFLFILDHSVSMKKRQVELRNKELGRSLKALKGSAQYQVILFAGGGYFAEEGWSVRKTGPNNIVRDPKGKEYRFLSKGGPHNIEFDGPNTALPKAKWLSATSSNISKTMKFVESEKIFWGTDWEVALRIGHYMEPPPDAIFFMADGTGGNDPPPILSLNRKRGKVKINTVAMQTTRKGPKNSRQSPKAPAASSPWLAATADPLMETIT